MDPYPFHLALLQTTTDSPGTITTPPKPVRLNVSDIIFRLVSILSIATIAVWANHEASKGFAIAIVNGAGKHSSAGKRFSLFYESNDKATRVVLNTSRYVENLLYPNQDLQNTKKQIKSVTLKLAPKKLPTLVSVYSPKPHEYVIMLCPSIMDQASCNNDVFFASAVLRGMARVWLWDGDGATPPVLMNGIVEYISSLAGFGGGAIVVSPGNDVVCWKDEDPRKVAGFLRHFDGRGDGGGGGGGGEVIRRLNDEMRSGWHDLMMDDALCMTGKEACACYAIFARHHYPSSSM